MQNQKKKTLVCNDIKTKELGFYSFYNQKLKMKKNLGLLRNYIYMYNYSLIHIFH